MRGIGISLVCFHLLLVALAVLVSGAFGGETTETVALRKVLESEATGWQRADAKLLLDLYSPYFAGYAGYTTADSVRWQVTFDSFEAFGQFAEAELEAAEGGTSGWKYILMRQATYFHVRNNKAVAVTQDSLLVTHRQTGEKRYFAGPVFWTFAKKGEDWLITGFVGRGLATGESRTKATGSSPGSLAEVLGAEAQAWNGADVGEIVAQYSDERFVGYAGGGGSNPGAWKVCFSDIAEFRAFLKRRLSRASYQISREVIYNHVAGRHAVVVTKEQVSTVHRETKLRRSLERYALWTLTRSGNKWQITSFYLDVGLPRSG